MHYLISFSTKVIACLVILTAFSPGQNSAADFTRLLRQPSLGEKHIVFTYGSDLWIAERTAGLARRLTSTPAVESDPHLSPDGNWVAFTSNRSGVRAIYVLPIQGGTPQRLTWYPASDSARGWTRDGKGILYASTRETAPSSYERLWVVPATGGASKRLPAPFGHDGCFSENGKQLVVEPVTRWDPEWRQYRGGQNKSLIILDLDDLSELLIPCQRTTDTQPIWIGSKIYFLSDRDGVVNLWTFDTDNKGLEQITKFKGDDIKWLAAHQTTLAFERQGYIHTLGIEKKKIERLKIQVQGDFPLSESRWEDVSSQIRSWSLSATGKRALFEARGEIFTVPVKKGDTRNLTKTSGAADRMPIWSPQGDQIAWFSDAGTGYKLLIAEQDGLSDPRQFGIGESKMAWEARWSPDGKFIAFVDDDVRIRLFDVDTGNIRTVDVGRANYERGTMGLSWSPDSKWLAYSKTYANRFGRIVVCPVGKGKPKPLTDYMAHAITPSWSSDGKYLYFLASTNLALRSGWANTSQINADPKYGAYMIVLNEKVPTPFAPESDEEEGSSKNKDDNVERPGQSSAQPNKNNPQEKSSANDDPKTPGKKKRKRRENKPLSNDDDPNSKKGLSAPKPKDREKTGEKEKEEGEKVAVEISLEGIARRIVALPIPVKSYVMTLPGPDGVVFIGEKTDGSPGLTLQRFSLKERKATPFAKGVSRVSISSDRQKMLYRTGSSWSVVDTGAAVAASKGSLSVKLRMKLDLLEEWKQIFAEAWHYQRDFFYDPGMHGRNWNDVRKRYAPLLPHVRHRSDLNYILDQMNGELSVGHSFVSGGDLPDVETSSAGVLGADLEQEKGRWRIKRILTFENWNPTMRAPLDRPGLRVKENNYILAVNGEDLTAMDDPYRLLDGTAGEQTVLHVNDKPQKKGSWRITVEPIRSENSLRQRAWVEDNRRLVNLLSNGTLAYVWVPNTGGPGLISFDRYLFAQQDKLGAVIDERFNGGGLLDDYMVDLMTRPLRAAITNEVPDGIPFRLPAGILGPKVLLINERAGSGGDFFPWVFRQQKAGKLIGTRTWGGLVKSSTHYLMVDGGRITAPDNAVFDPINEKWIAENEGVAPDIEVRMDAKAVWKGRDPQIERGVRELLKSIQENPPKKITPPAFPRPAKLKGVK